MPDDAPKEVRAATDALATAAAAVTGPGTPNAATIKTTPDRSARWALILAGPAISAMLVGCIAILTWVFWPDVVRWKEPGLGEKIILGVSSVAMVLAILLGLVVFRLASGGLKSVTARALGGSLEINTDDDEDDGPRRGRHDGP
jgi:hypothetical protein